MASRFTEIVVDAHDTRGQAEFWSEVLGYRILDEEDNVVEIGTQELTAEEVVRGPVPPTIVFVPVPEDKTVKNRLHIDVSPIDREPAEEVERLIALGARRVDIGQGEVRWTVLADPEGNEFCVLRRLGQ
jgi:Glyoxalase-like domain